MKIFETLWPFLKIVTQIILADLFNQIAMRCQQHNWSSHLEQWYLWYHSLMFDTTGFCIWYQTTVVYWKCLKWYHSTKLWCYPAFHSCLWEKNSGKMSDVPPAKNPHSPHSLHGASIKTVSEIKDLDRHYDTLVISIRYMLIRYMLMAHWNQVTVTGT